MSLNFVSSAILTSTDGVSHNEEKAVETSEAQELRSNRQPPRAPYLSNCGQIRTKRRRIKMPGTAPSAG